MTSTRLLLARQLMNRLAKRTRKGFTLIELLVVVVIIGILASVALPSFVGAQDKARNASVQSNARTIQMALEEFSTEHNGAYPLLATDWDAATDGLVGVGTTYLPGGKLPLSPWCKQNQADGIVVSLGLLSAAASVAATPPVAMPAVTKTKGHADTGAGSIVDPPTAIAHYGSVAYDYHAGTQYYVLYTMGKKGKDSVLVAAISNAGQ